MPKKKWTQTEEEMLLKLRKHGNSAKYLAQIFGCDAAVIHDKLYKLKNPSPLKLRTKNAAHRTCLRCKKPFRSEHAGHRICNSCKQYNATQHNIQYAVSR